ncbi:hypothetical protein [Bacteroides sp. 519]|uniref:hypothetical protein n=1 Tax=Bacteroides sp. 519 TaxID=2302937 RepID=UPI0013D37F4B|nr:hypothetical protein [Bacteroides sp. 519]NDV60158.1 hypothetical protein [Bacteroides sp. 519]
MKKIYSILILTLLFSCSNKNNEKVISRHIDSAVNELLDSEIRKGVKTLSELEEVRISQISINKSCFILESWIDEIYSDSIVSLTFNTCRLGIPESYKGVIYVDGYNVAIFDHFNILTPYYNSDSLHQIPFENFICYPLNYIIECPYNIKNGVLKEGRLKK